LKILRSEVWKGGFHLMQILGLLGMYFDAVVVFVINSSFLFRFAVAMLWAGWKNRIWCQQLKYDIHQTYIWIDVCTRNTSLVKFWFLNGYRVFRIALNYFEDLGDHIKTTFWLWWRYLCIPEVRPFEFHQPAFKKVT
jgi:hypothetical protein